MGGVPRPLRVHVEIRWEGHGGKATGASGPLECAAVGYVLEGAAYVSGVLIIGGGVYLAMRGAFPDWWGAWPLAKVTPRAARLQGLAVIVLGASILPIVFTTVTPAAVGGGLVLGAIAAYMVGLGLFGISAWSSRRLGA